MTTSTTLAERAKANWVAWVADQIARAGPRDWTEDFHEAEGQYMNVCCNCHQIFQGHKRRVECKRCAGNQVST